MRPEPHAGAQTGTAALGPRRSARRARGAALLGAALLAAAVLYPQPPLPFRTLAPLPGPAPDLSVLALGDTGESRAIPSLRSGQLAVARALVEADLQRPADLLLLLGDNFYPSGLLRGELVQRVRENLVTPYCRFADLSGPRSREVAAACSLPAALRRAAPIPILAILGNHDHKAPESPELQRDAVPEFLPNWRLAESPVERVELRPGLQLVLVDTTAIRSAADAARVRDALREAKGPWRILAVHEPFAAPTAPVPWQSSDWLRRALAGLEVPVQLVLTGHNHALQVVQARDPFPALHVMAGAGSTDRVIDERYLGEELSLSRTGFTRVEWWAGPSGDVGGSDSRDGGRLEVTLYEAARYPIVFFLGPRPVASWTIHVDGRAVRQMESP